MNADGVVTLVKNDDSNLYKEALEKALSDALGMLSSAKEREGRGTYEDLLRLGKEFKSSVDMINGKSREIEQYFRLLFSNRYSELLSDKEIDEEARQTIGLLDKRLERSKGAMHSHYYYLLNEIDTVLGCPYAARDL